MPRTPLPQSLTWAPLSRTEAREAGLGWRRLTKDDIARPHRGVYVAAVADPDLVQRCRWALPLLGEHRWFSHLTAARLCGIPLPFSYSADEPLHVLSLPGAEPLRRPGIVGWSSTSAIIGAVAAGMPVVTPALAWAQLATPGAAGVDPATGRRMSLGIDDLVAAGDFLLTGPRRDRRPLCSIAELRAIVDARAGRRGAKALREALEHVRAGAHSPRETRLRLALVRHGLPEPVVQIPILTSVGLRHADLGYPAELVAIEYHGDHHREDRRQWLEDLTRRQLFEDAGWYVIEIGAADLDVDDGRALAARVRRVLAARSRG